MPVALWSRASKQTNKNKLSKHVHRECCRLPLHNKPLFLHSLWKLNTFSYRLLLLTGKYFISPSSNKLVCPSTFHFRQSRRFRKLPSFAVYLLCAIFSQSITELLKCTHLYRYPYCSKMCKSNKYMFTGVGVAKGKKKKRSVAKASSAPTTNNEQFQIYRPNNNDKKFTNYTSIFWHIHIKVACLWNEYEREKV